MGLDIPEERKVSLVANMLVDKQILVGINEEGV